MAEPTSITCLGLSVALADAGVELALVGSRHVARLRSALSGEDKSDLINAAAVARRRAVLVGARGAAGSATLALQRASRRRHELLIEANRC